MEHLYTSSAEQSVQMFLNRCCIISDSSVTNIGAYTKQLDSYLDVQLHTDGLYSLIHQMYL